MLKQAKIVEEDFRRLHITDSPAQIVDIILDYQNEQKKKLAANTRSPATQD